MGQSKRREIFNIYMHWDHISLSSTHVVMITK